MKKWFMRMLLLVVTLFLIACSPSRHSSNVTNPRLTNPTSEIPNFATSNVFLLTEKSNTRLDASTTANLIVLDKSFVESTSIVTGSILIIEPTSIFPGGGLKKVAGVSVSKNRYQDEVNDAYLTDVIDDAKVEYRSDINFESLETASDGSHSTIQIQNIDKNGAIRLHLNDHPVFENAGLDLSLSGYIDFTGSVSLDWDIKAWKVEEMQFEAAIQQNSSLGLSVKGYFDEDKSFLLGKPILLPKQVLNVRGVPVVLQTFVELYVSLTGSAEAGTNVELNSGNTATVVMHYYDLEFDHSYELNNSMEPVTAKVPEVDADVSISITPRVGVKIYGLDGPSMGLS